MSFTNQPSTTAPSRIPPLWLGILSLLIILIFTPILVFIILMYSDYQLHINWAIGLELTGHFEKPIPQFLYHVLLIGIRRFMPGPGLVGQFAQAAIVEGFAYYVAIGLIVFFWFAHAGRQFISRWKWPLLIFLTLTVMLVSSINLLTWGRQNLYLGYLAANTYQNPTILLSKPFSLLLFAFAIMVFSEGQVRYSTIALCALTALLATFAKPNYPMALVPAVVIAAGYTFLKKRTVNRLLLAAIVVPVTAALAWQYAFYQSDQAGGFEIAPLKVMNFYSPDGLVLVKLLLSIAFPAAVYLLYYPLARSSRDLNLAWLVFGVSAVFTYLLAEKTGWETGNFTWASQVALFALFAVSIRFMIVAHTGASMRIPRWKLGICALLLGLHLVGGLALYLSQLRTDWTTWW